MPRLQSAQLLLGYAQHAFSKAQRGILEEGAERCVGVKGQGVPEPNLVFWTRRNLFAHELTGQEKQSTFQHGEEVTHELLPLSEELLTSDKGESIYLRIWLLLGQPCSSGRSHTQEYIDRTNQIQWVIE